MCAARPTTPCLRSSMGRSSSSTRTRSGTKSACIRLRPRAARAADAARAAGSSNLAALAVFATLSLHPVPHLQRDAVELSRLAGEVEALEAVRESDEERRTARGGGDSNFRGHGEAWGRPPAGVRNRNVRYARVGTQRRIAEWDRCSSPEAQHVPPLVTRRGAERASRVVRFDGEPAP